MRLVRSLTALASPAGRRGRLSAFVFHRVLPRPDPSLPDEVDAVRFDRMLDWIGAQFQVLDPVDACRRLAAGALPARAAILTFDDGYRDNAEVALPLLRARKMPAVFFVATGFTGGSAMFNDRIRHAVWESRKRSLGLRWLQEDPLPVESPSDKLLAFDRIIAAIKHLEPRIRAQRVESVVQAAEADAPRGLMMDEGQLKTLAEAGMTLGGHTRHHPILRALPDPEAREEIAGCRQDLADVTGEPPPLFAYPNGRLGRDYDALHAAMARQAGYDSAFTTHPGAGALASDPHQLPRFTPWDPGRLKFMARSLLNLMASGAAGESSSAGAARTGAGSGPA